MKVSLRQFGKQARVGFTLVELLVVIAILAILTTLTVSAFTLNDADRVSNSIGTFKNALEGARSRAINSGEVRGLRLITDPNDPRIVKSMVYIGSAGKLSGNLTISGYNIVNNRFIITEQGGGNEWGPIGVYTNGRRLIQKGSRIEIPASSGRWYTIYQPTTSSGDTTMIVSGRFMPSKWNTSSSTYEEQPNGGTFSYNLELEPTLLDGADPILLDPKTCIDLDGSRVPGSWRILEDKDQDRAFDSMAGDVDVDSDGLFDFSGGYINQMDILFGPDGTVAGTVRTSGVISFRFAYQSDVILSQPLREIPQGSTFPNVSTYPQFLMYANPEKIHKALTIFPQTGGVVVTEIDPTTSGTNGGFNSNLATQPYSYALLGRESN